MNETKLFNVLMELVKAVERDFPNWSSTVGQGGHLVNAAKKALSEVMP
jgi:hypothetical protein